MKQVIGVADMNVSCGDTTILTHALGSCLGIVIHDPVARVGGMLHVMLPQSNIDPEKGKENPCMFVDTGVPMLFREAYKVGAEKRRLIVKVAGGAAQRTEVEDRFQIGKRNILALRNILWKNGVLLLAQDVGGCDSRHLTLDVGTGQVTVQINGESRPL